jgi:hypothetical protein
MNCSVFFFCRACGSKGQPFTYARSSYVRESQIPHNTRYWILAVSTPIAHDIFTHDTYFCLYKPVSLGHCCTLPDNHYADTLLLCVPTVWSSESRHNLCILFEQYNSSANARKLEFQFLKCPTYEDKKLPLGYASYQTNILWDTTAPRQGAGNRGECASQRVTDGH